jgi:hypothetical protein
MYQLLLCGFELFMFHGNHGNHGNHDAEQNGSVCRPACHETAFLLYTRVTASDIFRELYVAMFNYRVKRTWKMY